MTQPLLRLTELCLVWGPLELPDDAVSFDDNWDTVIYTPDEIADAILSVPQTQLIHPADPDWASWSAKWNHHGHTIDFDIIETDTDPDYGMRPGLSKCWGGSGFVTNCTLEEIIDVWATIQRRCPAVWLHDTSCRMYNPGSFRDAVDAKLLEWSR